MAIDLEALYIDLHQHPELSFQETRTAGIAAQHLRDLGLEVEEGVGVTGVVGVLRNPSTSSGAQGSGPSTSSGSQGSGPSTSSGTQDGPSTSSGSQGSGPSTSSGTQDGPST
ncbi:hypothetical protein P5X92_04085, partial [Microbacterium sp. RD12]|nr:hypothetical protein [Microbacterium sp. RD12]